MPRKLGQHFLADEQVLRQLAAATCEQHCPRVIEVGPGRGALTRFLLPLTDELHLIEVDSAMVADVKAKWPTEAKLHVHHEDVLRADLAAWGPAVITGNLPYYITSPIIEKFLRLDERFPAAVFLMQAEVAERITAKPGTRDYGYLSVLCQLLCTVELVCKVPAGAFRPPPKVESAALRFSRRSEVAADWEAVVEFAGRAFAHKRKTLRNNLRGTYPAIEGQPEAGLRAEQLSPTQLAELYRRLRMGQHLSEDAAG